MSLNNTTDTAKTLNADEIARRIPHGTSMSLLDKVNRWDEKQINCSTRSHLRDDNPLLEGALLSSVSLVEYGAQAAAIHASLLQSGMGNTGPAYLAAIKSLELFSETVDGNDELDIEAIAELHNNSGAIYYFSASIKQTIIAQGRLVLVQPSQ
jgi:predicted hotdog family 3-hydroxylacyl-ACP dehydratase